MFILRCVIYIYSTIENQDKGSKTPEQIYQEHFEVQEVEKEMEEQLQYVPEDDISQIE